MSLVDKIKAQLKAKFPKVNLSTKRQDAIAARLDKKIKEESEIDAALDDLNELTPFAEIAKDDDRVRTLELKLKDKDKAPDNDDDDDDDETPATKPVKKKSKEETVPEWAKGLLTELQELKADKVKATVADKVKAHQKLKDIPEAQRNLLLNGRALPQKEEDIDSFAEGVEADFIALKQSFVDEGLSQSSTPILGGTNKEGVSTAVEQYIASKNPTDNSASGLGGKKI